MIFFRSIFDLSFLVRGTLVPIRFDVSAMTG